MMQFATAGRPHLQALEEQKVGKGVRSQLPERPLACFAQLTPDPFTRAAGAGKSALKMEIYSGGEKVGEIQVSAVRSIGGEKAPGKSQTSELGSFHPHDEPTRLQRCPAIISTAHPARLSPGYTGRR